MKSVENNKHTIIIKNSKFICLCYHVSSIEMVEEYLKNAKSIYKDATHYCYAYIINGISKCSDDGEPSGTAGIPMLNVLKMNHLNYVLCITIRYFGKILLGASGLVRAYSKSVTLCIKDHMIELEDGYNLTIAFPYSLSNQINYLLKEIPNIQKEFDNLIYYTFDCNVRIYQELTRFKNITITINHSIQI